MTSEELQSARAERWRQTANPIVTADDARAWIEEIGLCLFLPRRAHFSVPAPSFVEAAAGASTAVPSRDVIEQATALLYRLTAERAVVPLNLFHAGGFGAGAGAPVFGGADQPDFVATRGVLPYVFSLIGGRNWKSGPGDKASPLMKEIWTLLDHEGALTAKEIQTALGRELTEAAVLRGLVELWGGLRAIPAYDGETTRWELTQARFAAEMTASQKVAQTTALSALVSFYLQAVIAASSEEVETFLSPLTARSRVREVVNGLQATRQLGLLSVNAQPLVHVAGALPEFAEEQPAKVKARAELTAGVAGTAIAGELAAKADRGSRESREERRPFRRGEGRGFDRGRPERGEREPRREYDRERGRGERPARKVFGKERRTAPGERGFGDRERRPFGKREFDSRPRGVEREKRFEGERAEGRRERGEFRGGKFLPKKFGKRDGGRPWQERGERRSYEKPGAGGDEGGRKFRERDRDHTGERRGERRADERGGERGGERRRGGFGERGRGGFGEKKFGGKKFGGEKRFGGPKKFGSRGSQKEFEREKRPFYSEPRREREGERGSERDTERTSRRESFSGARSAQRSERGTRQGKPEFRGTGKSKFGKKFGERGAGKGGGKSRFGGSGKPFGKSDKKFGKTQQAGGAKRAGSQQGGFKPPFRKRKDREDASGE